MLKLKNNLNSMEAEAYKTLRTNIEYSPIRNKIKTILITSADSKDGRSTVCKNIGMAFAENGQSVIIIDCDFRNSSMHKLFNIPNSYGLSELLTEKVKLEDIINNYSSNISILTTGEPPTNPSEILGSEKMDNLLKFLKEKYDLILIDSPPVELVTDAQILSTKVCGTIMVIMAEKTKSKRVIKL